LIFVQDILPLFVVGPMRNAERIFYHYELHEVNVYLFHFTRRVGGRRSAVRGRFHDELRWAAICFEL